MKSVTLGKIKTKIPTSGTRSLLHKSTTVVKHTNLVLYSGADLVKRNFVYKLFWGRGNLYRLVLHIFLITSTAVFTFSGIYKKLYNLDRENISFSEISATGNTDLLQQGGSIETVLKSTTTTSYKVWKHVVVSGDTLDNLATSYKVSKDTIKWANQSKIDYYKETLNPGDELLIPEINGVLVTVKDGDTLDSVISSVQQGNRSDTIEVNLLEGPDYTLKVGSTILVPDASLAPPPPPPPEIPVIYAYYSPTGDTSGISYGGVLNGIQFVSPVSHPSCAGYSWNRGFTPWHNGVDLGKNGGCNLRAAAAGRVTAAGWGPYGEGYHVDIDHGNGVTTVYYHSDGNIWVRVGDYVEAGQEIMYMGCSGYCTGTHLHLGLRVNWVYLDPAGTIPY